MIDEDKLEYLCYHYQRQIDENRAVSRSLDELREHISDLRWRMNAICNHLSFEEMIKND